MSAPARSVSIVRLTASIAAPAVPTAQHLATPAVQARMPARAYGAHIAAAGINSSAFGSGAQATTTGDTALGSQAIASGGLSTAVGIGATATFSKSAAFGNGATATRADQQVFGTSENTYTMARIASDKSKSAQGAPTSIVTSNASGDLAAYTPGELGLATTSDLAAINSEIANMNKDIRRTTEGVALAMAMAGVPTLMPNENIALTANWGTFEGEHGIAGAMAFRIDRNVQLNAGIGMGLGDNTVGGRAGVRVGW